MHIAVHRSEWRFIKHDNFFNFQAFIDVHIIWDERKSEVWIPTKVLTCENHLIEGLPSNKHYCFTNFRRKSNKHESSKTFSQIHDKNVDHIVGLYVHNKYLSSDETLICWISFPKIIRIQIMHITMHRSEYRFMRHDNFFYLQAFNDVHVIWDERKSEVWIPTKVLTYENHLMEGLHNSKHNCCTNFR